MRLHPPYHPWSTVTSILYPVAGGLAYDRLGTPEALVFLVCMTVLGLGTAAFHWKPRETWARDFDHVGMNMTFAALYTAVIGGSWWLMAVVALVGALIEVTVNPPNHGIVAVFALGGLLSLMATGQWVQAAVIFGFFSLAFAMWLQRTDFFHAMWHLNTSIGTLLLFVWVV